MICSLPHPRNDRQRKINGALTIFDIASWKIQRAARSNHEAIIALSAAFLGKPCGDNIASMS
jgi:hypothetical protein